MVVDGRLVELAKRVIDTNKYLTLGTVDADGQPWVSPVFFTPEAYTHFYWVSSPESRHSRNLADHPGLSIVVFDSSVPIGGAEAVYMTGRAGLVPDDELERCSALYSGRLPELRHFPPEQLREPAPFRLYRATVSEHSVLVRGGDPDHGTGVDSRLTVTL
ncbi:MAG: pyridoxamine 5'-phosphate oxidase family protein [Micromonosporaceae bacterium]